TGDDVGIGLEIPAQRGIETLVGGGAIGYWCGRHRCGQGALRSAIAKVTLLLTRGESSGRRCDARHRHGVVGRPSIFGRSLALALSACCCDRLASSTVKPSAI